MAKSLVQIDVLGPLQVRVGERRVAITAKKQRALLLLLALRAGQAVRVGELIDALWGDHPPPTAEKTLQTYVFRIRKELGAATIRTEASAYAMALGDGAIDAQRFESAVAAGRRALVAACPDQALRLFDEALGLWRGEPYVDLDHHAAVHAAATRLHELRATVLEDRAEALLAAGHAADIVPELEALVAEHPFRERLWCHLMLALYRSGRQRDSLRAYRRARKILTEELGIEPSPELRRLEHAVLTQTPGLDGALAGPCAPTVADRGDPAAPEHLAGVSRPATNFVGREQELRDLIPRLRAAGLVTVTGPAGVGKTRLAIEAAAATTPLPDGVCVVEFAAVTDEFSVAEAVATALGLRVPPVDGAALAVAAALRSRQCLLVLDNCEHLIDAVRALLLEIASTGARPNVLATSREPLSLDGEHVCLLAPLPVPDREATQLEQLSQNASVRLFVERARAARPDFALTSGNAAAVAEICQRLDGLPLAIELAAAQMRTMGPADVVGRLHERFRLLRRGSHNAARRHQGLQAAIDWSYRLLGSPERALFDRLSVFVGAFGLEEIEKVCAFDAVLCEDVPHLLSALVEKSMVAVSEADDGTGRYSLLESLRQFAAERLATRCEDGASRRRHAQHFADVARGAGAGVLSPDEASWVRRLEAAFPDIRAAHAWALANFDACLALSIPADLLPFGERGHGEVLRWAEAAIALPGAETEDRYPDACAAAAHRAGLRGDIERAQELGRLSLAAAEARGTRPPSTALYAVALRGYVDGSADAVEEHLRRSELARGVDDAWNAARGLAYAAQLTGFRGETKRALEICAEGWRLAARTGNPSLRAGLLYVRGEILQDRDPIRARADLEEAIVLARSVHNWFIASIAQVCLGSLCARHGDARRALDLFIDMTSTWHRDGAWRQQWVTLRNVAELLGRLELWSEAVALLSAIDAAPTATSPFGGQADRLTDLRLRSRERLSDHDLQVAVDHGAGMTDDEAVLFALTVMEHARSRL